MEIFGETFVAPGRVLDFTMARMQALAQNIANANTPGYRRMDVDFAALVKAARLEDDGSRRQALEELQPEYHRDDSVPSGPNGNNVLLEHEIAEMQKAAVLQQIATQLVSGRVASLRLAITGRS